MKNYWNIYHALNSLKKQGIRPTQKEIELIKFEFVRAEWRSELPLSESLIKSMININKELMINKSGE